MPARAQRKAYEGAAKDYAADPRSATSIATMMRLASEGVQPSLRRWASQWLRVNCNIVVIVDEPEGMENATPAEAVCILR